DACTATPDGDPQAGTAAAGWGGCGGWWRLGRLLPFSWRLPVARSASDRLRDRRVTDAAHRARSLPGCPRALLDRARSALGRPLWTCTPGRENGRDIASVPPPSGSASRRSPVGWGAPRRA